MGGLAQIVVNALSPYVGQMAASTCVRATALSIGKTADELTLVDLAALEANVRKLLAPVAPENVVSRIITEIQGAAR